MRAIVARPNICGYNAYHTSGGVLLRPSSTSADAKLAPIDVWVWKQLAERGTELTGYPAHSVYEDFTWDHSDTMSGAADDWAYEHLGVYGWTTEFWDIVHAATGNQAVDPLLVHRPHRRRGAGRAALVRRTPPRAATSTGIRSSIPSSARSRSVAGTICSPGSTRPRHLLRREVERSRRLRDPPGAVLAAAGDPPLRRRAGSATTRGGSRSGSPTPAGCRPT